MYEYYVMHDPIGNWEQQLTNYDPDYIQKVFDSGLIIIGVTAGNKRTRIGNPKDVVEPDNAIRPNVPIVLPSYVDSKIEELAGIVETLVDSLSESSQIETGVKNHMLNKLTDMRIKAKQAIEKEAIVLEKAGAKIQKLS